MRRKILASFAVICLVKFLLDYGKLQQNPQKIIYRKVRSSFKRIDFHIDEPNFLKNMRIFEENSVMYIGKSIFKNLMSSIHLRLIITKKVSVETKAVLVKKKDEEF